MEGPIFTRMIIGRRVNYRNFGRMEAGFFIEKKCSMHCATSSSPCPDTSEMFWNFWLDTSKVSSTECKYLFRWLVCMFVDFALGPKQFLYLPSVCLWVNSLHPVSSSGRSVYDSMSLGGRFKRWKRWSLGSSWSKLIQMQDFFSCQHHPNKCLSYAPCFPFENI